MLQIKSLSKHYGPKVLFENAEANLGERSRVALVGANGAGKSTLIKLILGVEHQDEGAISKSPYIKIGHLAQELPKFEDRTVIEEGMTFTIEPMITIGSPALYVWDDDWTAVTLSGQRCAQFEHTLLVTSDGVEILTLPEATAPAEELFAV